MVAYDFGIKSNIMKRLASHGCNITVVPASMPAAEVMAMNPDGVFFSNGVSTRPEAPAAQAAASAEAIRPWAKATHHHALPPLPALPPPPAW